MTHYEGPVVDAHQHFWDPSVNDYPWLRPEERRPFRYGNYNALKRRYLPPDYRKDAGGKMSARPSIVRRGGIPPIRRARPSM